MPNHGVVLAGPILAVLFDPTYPWSSSPLVCLTLHRDSGLKLFRALNQTRTQPSYQEGLLLIPHEICIIRSFRPTHTFRHSPATQHCSLSKAGETVVTPIWSSSTNPTPIWSSTGDFWLISKIRRRAGLGTKDQIFAVLIDIETVLTQTQSAFKTYSISTFLFVSICEMSALRKWKTTIGLNQGRSPHHLDFK